MTQLISHLGERDLISRITSRIASPPWVIVGPGDDAAVVSGGRGLLDVLTTDAQVEGIHFDRTFVPPDAIGHRALAVNLSDLAAMGAAPRAALLSLVLPATLEVAALDGMLDGFLSLAEQHNVALVGGNITRTTGPAVIDVTATGTVHPRRILRRSGARPGDDVYVTGQIGAARAGLAMLRTGHADPALAAAYQRPTPRVRAGMLIGRNKAASACMDVSDGLADAARQVAEQSGVGVILDASALPVPSEARRWYDGQGLDATAEAVAGGDDYELLFTSGRAQRSRLRSVKRLLGDVAVTKIGEVTRERRLVLRTASGDRDLPAGFEHYR